MSFWFDTPNARIKPRAEWYKKDCKTRMDVMRKIKRLEKRINAEKYKDDETKYFIAKKKVAAMKIVVMRANGIRYL